MSLTEKKSNHQVNIVRVTEFLPHNNADNLEIVKINDYQVKGEFTAKERHVPGVGRAQLKPVSSEFLAKDSK